MTWFEEMSQCTWTVMAVCLVVYLILT